VGEAQKVDIVGRTYPEVTIRIEPDRVDRFARVIGADPGRGVPPTYAAVYALENTIPQLFLDEEARIDYARLVHGEQQFTWTRHPEVGETLVAQGRVVEDNERRNLRFVTFETVCRDPGGNEVCRSRMLSIIRGQGIPERSRDFSGSGGEGR
jgi:hypothetical protein